MVDVVDSATRSRMMSGIPGCNTKPEILIRSLLHRQGFRFRLHVSDMPGKLDIVLPPYHAVLFVHGCLWHGYNCSLFKLLGTRPVFWREKIERNRNKNSRDNEALLADGWRDCIIWECALRGAGKNIEGVAQSLAEWLRSDTPLIEVRG